MCEPYNGAPNYPTHRIKELYGDDDDFIRDLLTQSADYYQFRDGLEAYCNDIYYAYLEAHPRDIVEDLARWAFRQIDWDHRARMIWDERESYWGIGEEEE